MKPEYLNPVLDTIFAHSSVRHFTGDDVNRNDEKIIVEAGQRASTSCNMQPYSFISIRNPETRRKIAGISKGAAMAANAPLVLMVCVDQYRLEKVAEKAGVAYYKSEFLDNFMLSVADASLAAQNAALAAESLGYGICYLGSIRAEMNLLRELLSLPQRVFPLFAIAIGVPDKKNSQKPRLPIEGVWFQESYDTSAAEKAVDDYNRQMAASGIYNGRHFTLEACMFRADADKSEESDNEYGWIDHTARRISSTHEADIRPEMKRILEEAGFSFK